MTTAFGRVLRTGLSSLRDRAANLRRRLAALRFNPSRRQRQVGVGTGCFLVGVVLGAEGQVAFALLEWALAALCLYLLVKEADEAQ